MFFRFILPLLSLVFATGIITISSRCTQVQELMNKPCKDVYVVMCDVTKSLDSNSIRRITDNAIKILDDNPNATIFYYPIDSNLYTGTILKKESYQPMGANDADAQQIKDRDMLIWGIKNCYLTKNARASCVMKGFEIAYSQFKQYPKGYKFKVFFLSDMLEHCSYSGSLIDIEKDQNYQAALDWVQKSFNPGISLKELDVELVFVITTRLLSIDEGKHRDFWRAVCEKYGYSKADFNKFIFSSDLPNHIR